MKLSKMLLPQPRFKLKVFLKSGQTMNVVCREWKLDRKGDEVVGYKFDGCTNHSRPFYIVPSQIIGIELVKQGYFV